MTATEVKTKILGLLDEVAAGEQIDITKHGRTVARLVLPIRSWLEQLARNVRTVGATPGIAAGAVALPTSFPDDPADRLIYATAVEHGWTLVTKDRRLREHPHPGPLAVS